MPNPDNNPGGEDGKEGEWEKSSGCYGLSLEIGIPPLRRQAGCYRGGLGAKQTPAAIGHSLHEKVKTFLDGWDDQEVAFYQG